MSDLIQIETRPDLSIIIPTYNKVAYTVQAVASLAQGGAEGVTYELIFVDNGSTDETISWVNSHTPGQLRGKAQGEWMPNAITLAHNARPRALARSWNMGIDNARGRHILVTNNDVIFAPGALKALLDAAKQHPQVGVFFPYGPGDIHGGILAGIQPPDAPETSVDNIQSVAKWWGNVSERMGVPGHAVYTSDPHLAQGWFCFLLRKEAWQQVGRFDESYELTGEDYDYAHRLRRYWKMAHVPRAYVEHYEHTTCLDLADEYTERLCRNRFRLLERHEGIQHFFSIVMPTFNRSDSLSEAIKSVQRQNFPHWRLYVVDDASEWSRVSRVAQQFRHDPRIWFFRRKERGGPGVARNYGLSLTEGKYVAFLDSDDIWHPDHLEAHWKAHESQHLAMAYSQAGFAWRDWDEATKQFIHIRDEHPTIRYQGQFDPKKLLEFNYIQTSGVSVHGDLARSLRFPPAVNNDWVGEDWEYFKAVSDAGGKGRPVLAIGKATCRYHIERNVHEEDHLIRRALPGLGPGSYSVRDKVVLPHQIKTGAYCPIGVVIPTRDRPEKLRLAIQSVKMTKTFHAPNGSLPVCVVDDGSKDPESIRRICIEEGVALIRNNEPLGPSAARNLGIAYLPSLFIQFLDDDDILIPDWKLPISGEFADDWPDVMVFKAWHPVEGESGIRLEQLDGVRTSQLLAKREVLLRVGMFDERLSANEEGEMLQRIQAQGASVRHLDWFGCIITGRGGSGDSRSRAVVRPRPDGRVIGSIGHRPQF